MSVFSFLRSPDINDGVAEFNKTNGAVLLDVRTEEEYRGGHIPQSLNLPLDKIGLIEDTVGDKNTPVYVYCLSGARSGRAVSYLKQAGYTSVKNIGGISSYKGKVVK
ncbi:MAG: rhodanese-like domain-containing protein [Candidatus Coproplasma sp.]